VELKCPRCELYVPRKIKICECGYNFETGEVKLDKNEASSQKLEGEYNLAAGRYQHEEEISGIGHEDSKKDFQLPDGYSWWQFKRRGPTSILPCRNCNKQATVEGNGQSLSCDQENIKLTPTGETVTWDTPSYQKFAKILAGAIAILLGTLIGSILLSVPFLWAVIAVILYAVLQPMAAFLVSRFDPGLTLQIWTLKCQECGQEQFVAPSSSVFYIATPEATK
jgi:hypothetical protein